MKATTGIDFGTTNSVVAQWNGGDVEVLPLDAHHLDADWRRPGFDQLFPSVVGTSSLRPGVLFGWEAKLRSEQAVEACKRLLKSDAYVTVNDRRFAATTVSAGVFRAMREGARRNLTDIERAVITVPANATGAARYRTRAAARFAGISVQALLNEPTAAAISYVQDMQQNSRILVFDWGGGTVDVTVLDHLDGFFEERASRGVTELGGLEIDRRLRQLVLDRAPAREEWSTAQDRQFMLDIERSKILLSQRESVVVTTPDGRRVEIGQVDLEGSIADLVDRALEPVEHCLEDLHLAPRDIDAVLMIGGTSQIPIVRAAVAQVMQAEPVSTALCDPMTAVARGAALAAAVMNGEVSGVVQVANAHALGTVVKDDQGKRRFSEIIRRNSPLPWSEQKSYTPQRDNEKLLKVEIWEGDPDRPLDHPGNVKLTQLVLTYPQPDVREKSRFLLEYTYDVNGLLHVKATLEHTGEVALDLEIDSFASGGSIAEVERDLATLLASGGHRPAIGSTPRATPAGLVGPTRISSPFDAMSSTAGPAMPTSPTAVRPIVVDGSNLAWIGRSPRRAREYEDGDIPSYAQLCAAIDALHRRYPDADLHIVVDATLRHRVAPLEREILTAALNKGEIIQPPAGTEGKGDALVAAIAEDLDALIVTNDNYVELQHRHPWLRESDRVLGASCSKGTWIFTPRTCLPARR